MKASLNDGKCPVDMGCCWSGLLLNIQGLIERNHWVVFNIALIETYCQTRIFPCEKEFSSHSHPRYMPPKSNLVVLSTLHSSFGDNSVCTCGEERREIPLC